MPPSTKNPPRPSPWLKRVLIPFWTIQLLLMIIIISVSGLLAASVKVGTSLGYPSPLLPAPHSHLSSPSTPRKETPTLQPTNRQYHSIAIIYMFFETICILLSISEIILFARHRLEPGTYLVLQVVKSTIWTVVFIIYVVRLATLKDGLGATNPLAFFLGGDLEAIILLCVAPITPPSPSARAP